MPANPACETRPGAAAEPVARSRAAGIRVLEVEADALRELAGTLDGAFDRAVALLAATTGRVVVTGIGKSGHVARKVSATFASTGTPAFFVHPSEASHGDLGMIARGPARDCVLAISNSGNTAELADIIAYCRRFRIPLIGLTSGAESVLAKQADCLLLLPPVPEACPMGLAPTTSTTMMLALGDALAIALLEQRDFTPDDYRNLHPGGALGQRLLKVADLMHGGAAVPLVGPDTLLSDAILVMTSKSFGCIGVVGPDGRLAGIVTDGDLRRHMDGALLSRPAGAIMTLHPLTIDAGALAAEALGTMNAHAVTSLFVVDAEERPLGILHIHDCLRAGVR